MGEKFGYVVTKPLDAASYLYDAVNGTLKVKFLRLDKRYGATTFEWEKYPDRATVWKTLRGVTRYLEERELTQVYQIQKVKIGQ